MNHQIYIYVLGIYDFLFLFFILTIFFHFGESNINTYHTCAAHLIVLDSYIRKKRGIII